MANFEFMHRKNIISERSGNKRNLNPGDIVRFNYRGINVHEPRPLVLVLNPNWKDKLHGIALHNIPDSTLNNLYKIVKERRVEKAFRKVGRVRKLLSGIDNPEKFYVGKIRPYIRSHFSSKESPYRTYTIMGISNVRLIDYRFRDFFEGEK